jgi:hypothetical protein
VAAKNAWPANVWRAIGLRRDEEPPAPAEHEAFKPLPTVQDALDALRGLAGQ